MDSVQSIGVLGSGPVGRALAAGYRKHGFEVMIGTRTASKLAVWLKTASGVKCGTFEETAVSSQVIIVAVPGAAAMACLESCGAENLAGKLVLDATNPVADNPPENGIVSYFQVDGFGSLMESLVAEFPQTNFVKAFNAIGVDYMIDPNFQQGKPTIFICGNHPEFKVLATELIRKVGHDVQDLGPATSACLIESLFKVWWTRGTMQGLWGHAFKLLTTDD